MHRKKIQSVHGCTPPDPARFPLTKIVRRCTMLPMRLDEFMEKVGVEDEELAKLVERDRSTISRLRRGAVKKPDAMTLLRLERWAEGVRRQKRWPARFSLTWDHLLPPPKRDADGAAA